MKISPAAIMAKEIPMTTNIVLQNWALFQKTFKREVSTSSGHKYLFRKQKHRVEVRKLYFDRF